LEEIEVVLKTTAVNGSLACHEIVLEEEISKTDFIMIDHRMEISDKEIPMKTVDTLVHVVTIEIWVVVTATEDESLTITTNSELVELDPTQIKIEMN